MSTHNETPHTPTPWNPCAKPAKACRYCGKVVSLRHSAGLIIYKPRHYAHKCPHGYDCLGGCNTNSNWPAIFIGNPPQLAKGCPVCHKQKLAEYETARAARAALESARQA